MRPNLKLVHTAARPQFTRRFTTDYAGAWQGHCKTRESAVQAAMRRILNDGYSRATITDRVTEQDVARLRLSDDRKRVVVEFIKPVLKGSTK